MNLIIITVMPIFQIIEIHIINLSDLFNKIFIFCKLEKKNISSLLLHAGKYFCLTVMYGPYWKTCSDLLLYSIYYILHSFILFVRAGRLTHRGRFAPGYTIAFCIVLMYTFFTKLCIVFVASINTRDYA